MQCRFETEASGRLLCHVRDADGEHVIAAANPGDAIAAMAATLDDVESSGSGDCYWSDSNSDYRWIFKRDGSRLRVAVLRLTGVVPGYQHVAWVEEEAQALIASLRAALGRAN
jgi:hypothetical protein